MQKFFYCDSCFLITCFQNGKLNSLSQYKDYFYISNTQIIGELLKPQELATIVRKSISIIMDDREEIVTKTTEFYIEFATLSFYDCLCMAYAFLDGYCLITDDIALQKKCAILHINIKTSKDIENIYLSGGDLCENLK